MSEVVSIIIPVYNVKEYIDECIISIVNQTYSNLEIILIDDGSSDGSAEICDKWAINDSRIHIAHQENRGVSSARNNGLSMSKGELITFVDADDWLEPDEIEKLVSRLISHEADMAVCGYINYSLKRNKRRRCPPERDCSFDEAVLHMINRITAVWGTMVRREIVFDDHSFIHMPEDIAYGEDEVWLLETMRRCKKIAFLHDALYHWRNRADSITKSKYISEKTLTIIEAKKKALTLLPADEEVQVFFKALTYYFLFLPKVNAYCVNDHQAFDKFSAAIEEMGLFTYWKQSRDINWLIKLKNTLLSFLMRIKINRKIVAFIYDIR